MVPGNALQEADYLQQGPMEPMVCTSSVQDAALYQAGQIATEAVEHSEASNTWRPCQVVADLVQTQIVVADLVQTQIVVADLVQTQLVVVDSAQTQLVVADLGQIPFVLAVVAGIPHLAVDSMEEFAVDQLPADCWMQAAAGEIHMEIGHLEEQTMP